MLEQRLAWPCLRKLMVYIYVRSYSRLSVCGNRLARQLSPTRPLGLHGGQKRLDGRNFRASGSKDLQDESIL